MSTLISCLTRDEIPELQLNAAWALTNIACANREEAHTDLIDLDGSNRSDKDRKHNNPDFLLPIDEKREEGRSEKKQLLISPFERLTK